MHQNLWRNASVLPYFCYGGVLNSKFFSDFCVNTAVCPIVPPPWYFFETFDTPILLSFPTGLTPSILFAFPIHIISLFWNLLPHAIRHFLHKYYNKALFWFGSVLSRHYKRSCCCFKKANTYCLTTEKW